MRLVSLHLENYRRYKLLDMEFPDGVVGILGDNGSGKSTLTEAIAWALYGSKPDLLRAGKDSLKWTGAGAGEGVEAVLVFEIMEHQYVLHRTLKTATLSTGEMLLANGTREVEDKVTRLLHMDYQEFSASVYARQKELDTLSRSTPNTRRKLIHRLMGITMVEDARDMARADRRRLEERREELSDRLNRDGVDQLSIARKERGDAKRGLEDVRKKTKLKWKELSGVRKSIEELEKKRDAMEDKRRKHEEFQKRLAVLKESEKGYNTSLQRLMEKIVSLEKKSENMEELSRLEKEYRSALVEMETIQRARELWDEKTRIQREVDELSSECRAAEEEMEALESSKKLLGELEVELESVQNRLKDTDKRIKEILAEEAGKRQHMRSLESILLEMEDHLRNIEGLGEEGVCPTCERPLGGHVSSLLEKYKSQKLESQELLENARKNLAGMEQEKNSSQSLYAALERKRKRMEADIREAVQSSKAAELLSTRLKKNRKRIGELESRKKDMGEVSYDAQQHEELKKRLISLEKSHDRFVALSEALSSLPGLKDEAEVAESRLTETRNSIRALEKDIVSLGFLQKNFEVLMEEIKSAIALEKELNKEHSRLQVEEARLSAASDNLARRIEDLEKDKQRVEELGDRISYLHRLAGQRSGDTSVYEDFLASLTGRIRPVLRSHASELFNLITDNRYGGIEMDGDYSIGIYDPLGGLLPVSRFSGGEEDVANLCLRLAVSRALSERSDSIMGVVILDEVFGYQDEGRRENVLKAMASLSGVFRQVFLITHVEDVKENVGYVMRVVENSDGSSSVVVE